MLLPLLILPTFLLAAPTPDPAALSPRSSHLYHRAGAPTPKPLGPYCKTVNPLPDPAISRTMTSFKPSDTLLNSTLYAYYLASSTAETKDSTTLMQQCVETCYGYGETGDCKSVYLGYEVPAQGRGIPPTGGDPSIACLMWAGQVQLDDFVSSPEGQGWTMGAAGDILCPMPAAPAMPPR
ncbi:hypothetical protein K402DRAFT_330726 [Aulographum hederae CBS 113979]|uniref:Uncharacterized protein n=1 Tax=Aulographum hederae CBS 113979 TaxID=1176131 RepID=A0A6G1H388_9PEZI|nr:hypothetical protein K402DRAFT_330726 [Aulographum hederae CBS 113979]